MRPSLKISFIALLVCSLWSTAFVSIKAGLKYSDPLFFASMRFMLAGLLLMPLWLKSDSPFKTIYTHIKKIFILGFFQTFLLYGPLFIGMTFVSSALTAIIIGSSPLIAAVISHFTMKNDKLTIPKITKISIGIIGVSIIVISRQPWSVSGFKELIGIALLLTGISSSAIGNIIVAKDDDNIDPVLLNSIQVFSGGFLLFIVSIFVEGAPSFSYPLVFYGALLWLSIVSAISFSLWFTLLRKPGVKVSELNMWKFTIPVFGAALSWIIFPDESPNMITITGMICVAVSVFLYSMSAQESYSDHYTGTAGKAEQKI